MKVNIIQVLMVDLLARALKKNVASCDKQCELQNSVNHPIFEGKLRSLDIQGARLSEHPVKPTHTLVRLESLSRLTMLGHSVYLNSIAIVKVVFGRLI